MAPVTSSVSLTGAPVVWYIDCAVKGAELVVPALYVSLGAAAGSLSAHSGSIAVLVSH